jgi:hypothetical protein
MFELIKRLIQVKLQKFDVRASQNMTAGSNFQARKSDCWLLREVGAAAKMEADVGEAAA